MFSKYILGVILRSKDFENFKKYFIKNLSEHYNDFSLDFEKKYLPLKQEEVIKYFEENVYTFRSYVLNCFCKGKFSLKFKILDLKINEYLSVENIYKKNRNRSLGGKTDLNNEIDSLVINVIGK
jgi:hypothetical protein